MKFWTSLPTWKQILYFGILVIAIFLATGFGTVYHRTISQPEVQNHQILP